MKLRNKKTGEIGNLVLNINPNRESYSVLSTENGDTICGNLVIGDYDTLAELNEEWEDYEEPKTFWAISWAGEPEEYDAKNTPEELKNMAKQIGNCFETREEAEKAVEKLKAWKRLEDKGFEINDWAVADNYEIRLFGHYSRAGIKDDLDLLFGGEE